MYNVHARKEKEWNSLHALLQFSKYKNRLKTGQWLGQIKEPHHLFFVLPDDKIDTEKTQVPVVA